MTDSPMKKIAVAQAIAAIAASAAAGIAAGGVALASALAGGFAVAVPSAYLAIRASAILRTAEKSSGQLIASAISLPTAKFLMTAGLLALIIGGGREWLLPSAFMAGVTAAAVANLLAMPLMKRMRDGV